MKVSPVRLSKTISSSSSPTRIGLAAFAGEEDAVEAAVGNGAAVEDRDALDALARREPVARAVPGDARPQLGELVGGIAAGEHVEHAVEDASAEPANGAALRTMPAERAVARCPGWRLRRLRLRRVRSTSAGGQRRMRDDGDDLLRQHVERVAQEARGLDVALVHGARHRGAGDQVGAVLREDDAVRGRAHLVAGAADALHAAGDRGRRFDLDDQVDRAHVDAELERRGRDQRLDLAGLEQLFDLDALRGGERAVVRARDAVRRRAR